VEHRVSLVGVFGGTFDPIHNGHVRPIREVQKQAGLDPILFIPNADPPHRQTPVANADHRLAMIKLALEGDPGLLVDDRELKRGGPSFMVDTLRSLQQDYASSRLCLVLGWDAFASFDSWHQWQEILRIAHIVVMNRPGWLDHDLPRWCGDRIGAGLEDLIAESWGRVVLVTVTPCDVSSTALRQRMHQGLDVHAELAPAVWDYICVQGLYGVPQQREQANLNIAATHSTTIGKRTV